MSFDATMQIAQIVPSTEAEGPGRRFAIWFQGCPLRCPGCCNPDMLSFEGGEAKSVAELLAAIVRTPDIEGITLLGGEPFAHAAPASVLAKAVRARGLSVMVFSGYPIEELWANPDSAVAELLAETDLLVDGPYQRDRPDTARRWIGSTNQRIHFLTDRYRADDPRWAKRNTLEIRVDRDGVSVNGFPAASAAGLWKGWTRKPMPRVSP
ncbi:MAG: radical SAM protein [Gemmataceae bacterium]|nr:radical SAM protein [Gemmataceae bacterium]